MKRIFIEDTRILSLVNDLRERLAASLRSKGITDLHILCVGESGLQVGQVLSGDTAEGVKILCDLGIRVYMCAVQKEGAILNIQLLDGTKTNFDEFVRLGGSSSAYFIIDGICRSGQTLTSIYNCIRGHSKFVWSYSVAVSVGSMFIPTWYGCMFEGSEYVVLARNGITPNTALYAKHAVPMAERLPSPGLVIRPPLDSDPDFEVDQPSLTRYTKDDRVFDSLTKAKQIVVLEWDTEPVGFVAFHIENDVLWIDYLVSCGKHRDSKVGIGTALYYHTETIAKMRGCRSINLWAIERRADWYKRRGFVLASETPITFGDSCPEKYFPMSHSLKSDFGHYFI
jgi:N-acetylglutamate synthase-like GNAT family acetyltransferase